MPKGFQKGQPRPAGAGRKTGQVNKLTTTVAARLQEWGIDPFRVLSEVAAGDLPCGVCHGKGKTSYQPQRGRPGVRLCESCYGSGKERVNPRERAHAASELAKYCAPQLKAIEVSGNQDRPIVTEIKIRFVDSVDGRPA